MLEGWYCRSLANQKTKPNKTEREHQESEDEHLHNKESAGVSRGLPAALGPTSTAHSTIDYKERYRNMKRKLKFLIYENEYFQDLLHTNQRRLLKVSRDRSFLIDRLLLYEKPANDSSDSDATDSSNSDTEQMTPSGAKTQQAHESANYKAGVRRKQKEKGDVNTVVSGTHSVAVSGATRGRKRKVPVSGFVQHPTVKRNLPTPAATIGSPSLQLQDQYQLASPDASSSLSTAEITRQLQERRPTRIELMSPECASATVPATMLSDESPSKIYPNESLQHLMEDDSPCHVAAEECVPMVYTS